MEQKTYLRISLFIPDGGNGQTTLVRIASIIYQDFKAIVRLAQFSKWRPPPIWIS
jgi:hypothetical protein